MRALCRIERKVVLCLLSGSALLIAGSASADTLDARCKEVDRTRQAECEIERPANGEWVLETSVQVASGRKAEVEALADAFCQAALRAGVSAVVRHRSELPDRFGEGASMSWRCGLPAVSARPR